MITHLYQLVCFPASIKIYTYRRTLKNIAYRDKKNLKPALIVTFVLSTFLTPVMTEFHTLYIVV